MPGEITYDGEKESHIIYLRDFRTQQCPDFLLHKCTNHRPFNCFSWHFANQKRRRPFKKKDGTFNYSPDIYCTKYDETTGICVDGDECQFLHRVAGDAERRYHLRYYKTCMCIYETDERGLCIKNGANCAYAHGNDDLRQPMVDALEGITINGNGGIESTLISQLENDMSYNDDPVWNDPIYVLINYKTEPCHRPHRLCRQGFACPSYHNPRDKRRSPQKFKYRSTPCPNVKHGDEWGDPPLCDNGENCSYCHTRTEQQFHPEIYKSSKCNDMLQSGYCPRGPFCAFAHIEKELTKQWPTLLSSDTHLSDFFEGLLPGCTGKQMEGVLGSSPSSCKTQQQMALLRRNSELAALEAKNSNRHISGDLPRIPEPIGKRRTVSLSECASTYPNVLRISQERQMLSRQHSALNDGDISNFNPSYPLYHNSGMAIGTPPISSNMGVHSSPRSGHLFPVEDAIESVIANSLEDDLGLGGILNSFTDDESLCSSLSTSYPTFSGNNFLSGGTAPMTIPNTTRYDISQELIRSFSSMFDSNFHGLHSQQNNMSPSTNSNFLDGSFGRNPLEVLMNGHSGTTSEMRCSICGNNSEQVSKMREELNVCKAHLRKWEEGINQARIACEAWRNEVEENKRRLKSADEEKIMSLKQRDELTNMLLKVKANDCLEERTSDDSLPIATLSRDTLTLLRQKLQEAVVSIDEKLKTMQQICVMCKTSTGKLEWMVCGHASVCVTCSKSPICIVCQTNIANHKH